MGHGFFDDYKLIVPIGTGTVISICIYSISVHLYRKMLRRVVICHRDYEI